MVEEEEEVGKEVMPALSEVVLRMAREYLTDGNMFKVLAREGRDVYQRLFEM